MRATSLFDEPAITVGDLCRSIRIALDGAFPRRVRVTGEVSACKRYPSGHVYFNLKDADGLVACVAWRSTVQLLSVALPIADGTAVEILGRVSIYKERSQFQLTVDDIVPVGHGALHVAFERLKEKLRCEGLFDAERKRQLPAFVARVAIVTSRDGAALQDFLTCCRRRAGHVEVILVKAPVQGDAAAPGLARAIRRAGRLKVDVVVVARGGGSIEDLWAFNTESVARAIAASSRPVISAVGHETDFTIADFVADLRAPTPTAAAEMITLDTAAQLRVLAALSGRLARALRRALAENGDAFARVRRDLLAAPQMFVGGQAQTLDGLTDGLRRSDPRRRLRDVRKRIDNSVVRMRSAGPRMLRAARTEIATLRRDLSDVTARGFARRAAALDVASAKLAALGPRATLARGYAIVHDEQGRVLTEAGATAIGRRIGVTLRRGSLGAAVTEIEETDDEVKG
ncbi:MAG TPA: exodeoxyribonuclease VII large subunit [Candidatus Eremiobacteraceae bacterium]|nr:exodeoxyribonuclease VII large subunit [Candidatus Eremiobacteraceae bacterium]